MKALLLSQYNQLDIADVPAPVPGVDEILVRVAACGICGSDVHGYDGTSGRRIPPLVMGHEAAGVVASVGTGVSTFKPGDRVRTKNIHPETHTRLPRYARDRIGTVEAIRGCHVFPDTAALGKGDDPQWLYTVLFDGRELWGENTEPSLKVSIEAFEPYLDRA